MGVAGTRVLSPEGERGDRVISSGDNVLFRRIEFDPPGRDLAEAAAEVEMNMRGDADEEGDEEDDEDDEDEED